MSLEMRPDCERCGADLPAEVGGAFICSFECTFCAECADTLDETAEPTALELSTLRDLQARTAAAHQGKAK